MSLNPEVTEGLTRGRAYGEGGLTRVDRFGVWLSLRAIRRHVDFASRRHVLDVGCGYQARLLQAVEGQIETGIGIDVRVSSHVKRRKNLTFLEGRIEEVLPTIAAHSMDAILLMSVLEHLWEPLDALRTCRRILRPGGVIVVNVPTWRGKRLLELSAFRLGLSPAAEMNDHKMYYDKQNLWPLLVRAGFRPSDVRMRRHKFGLNLFAVAGVPSTGSSTASYK